MSSNQALDISLELSIIAIVISLLSVVFSGWQAYHTRRMSNLQKQELDETKDRFLGEKRQIHYKQLLDIIFQPLATYQSVHALWEVGHPVTNWSVLGFGYDISALRSSPYFTYAEKHLSKDNPKFLSSVQDLESSAKGHNLEVLEYMSAARKKVEDALSEIAPVSKQVNPPVTSEPIAARKIYLQTVLEILERYWLTDILFTCSHGKQLGQAIADLDRLERDYPPKIEGAAFRLGGYTVAEGLSDSEEKRLTDAIIQLRQNWDILSKIVDFEKRREQMEQTATELRKQIAGLAHLIEANRYETICDCCPQED